MDEPEAVPTFPLPARQEIPTSTSKITPNPPPNSGYSTLFLCRMYGMPKIGSAWTRLLGGVREQG